MDYLREDGLPGMLALALSLPCSLAAQSTLLEVNGPLSNDKGIRSVAAVGDVDRDGFPDFAVGFPSDKMPSGVNSGSANVYSGRDGHVIYRFLGSKGLGQDVAGVGDANGDGFPDIAVSAPAEDHNRINLAGVVRLHSGKDGALLWRRGGTRPYDLMGFSLAKLGDLNKDGYDDVVVGLIGGNTGEVQILSGKDGSMLRVFVDSSKSGRQGWDVCGAGDVDRDGYPDVYAGSSPGWIRLYSGKTGKVLWSHFTPYVYHYPVLSNVGDIDRDGIPDVGVGSGTTANSSGVNAGSVTIMSGKTGKVIRRVEGKGSDYMGIPVKLGDVDGDGFADFGAGASQVYIGSPLPGYLKAFSGRTGKLLFMLQGRQGNEGFSTHMDMLGDLTGDKSPEILVSSYRAYTGTKMTGRVNVISLKTLGLVARPSRLSPKTAGSQSLEINAGSQHAAQNYWIFGSMTGTRPGTRLGSLTVPLNLDLYTELTIGIPNAIYFGRFRGTLDSQGRAQAAFYVPAGLPALPPFTLYHAYLVYDRQGNIRTASNSVSLRLE